MGRITEEVSGISTYQLIINKLMNKAICYPADWISDDLDKESLSDIGAY